MDRKLLHTAEQFNKKHRKRSTWKKIVSVLGCIVVFCTTYALILPAITMENTYTCETEEHEHTDACYDGSPVVLGCQAEEHTHRPECFNSDGIEICGYTDVVIHSHDTNCQDENGEMVCTLAAVIPHTHTEACWQTPESASLHVHSDACYIAERGALLCTEEEQIGHRHSDETDCFTYSDTLVCGQQETAGHQHSEASLCYADTEVLICTLEETEEHQHAAACYDIEQQLVCNLVEAPSHTHTESCHASAPTLTCMLEEISGHAHTDTCYEQHKVLACSQSPAAAETTMPKPQLVCGQIEIIPHTHSTACLDASALPICGSQQVILHQHTADCLADAERIPICGLETHKHDEILCYIDPTADLETASQWESTLPKELTGIWQEDLLAVAESQLGYKESKRNIIADENKKIFGYTRYGDWYGDDYGDWCAMFVSFCLHYAEIPEDVFPQEASCLRWIEALRREKYDLYRDAAAYTPKAGDLVFFDPTHDGLADHVGIITEVAEDTLKTIEGNIGDMVQRAAYAYKDSSILGYGILPIYELPTITKTAVIYTDETYETISDDDTVITLTGPIPEDSSVHAFPVTPDTEHPLICAYDIRIILPDGTEYEPSDTQSVSVSVQLSEEYAESAQDAGNVAVYYVPEEGEAELVSSTETEEGIVFDTDHFSVYAFVDQASISVNNQYNLKSAIDGKTGQDIYIMLAGDFGVYIDDANGEGYGYIDGPIEIPENSTVYLDLNGHTIWHHGTDALFSIPANSTLVIMDRTIGAESVETVSNPSYLFENLAEIGAGEKGGRLTYYVTTSTVVNSATGQTEEKLEKRTVQSVGGIKAGAQPVFKVDGGTLNIDGGFIYGGSGRAITQTSGTTNLLDGYICGFNGTDNGGAIYTTGGTLNIGSAGGASGTVLAGNSALRGGAIFAQNTTVNMSGGVLSGNVSTQETSSQENSSHFGGGGMYLNNCNPAVISGGYITNNLVKSNGYFDGGGGILASGNTHLTVKGGYITGNSASSGGGIRTDWQSPVTLSMESGYVCSNLARSCEGGGISVNILGTAVITGGYINNNETATPSDWGGGGVFGSTGSTMYIRNVLITDNHAGGYGGGVAGCSTGRVYICVQEGGAIFYNSADGQNMSGSTSTKNEDWVYAYNNEVFTSNGYQDYFCALNSIVEGSMLGGHPAYWEGSADGAAVRASGSDTLVAAYVMGLTAKPTVQGISAAQNLSKVYINGNTSNTHGGGILCNGYMIIGETTNIDLGARIELKASKEFLGSNAEKIEMAEDQFTFTVTDAQTGAVLATATNNAKGEIEFKERLPFTEAGTFVFYIKEVPGDEADIVFDTTTYRLTVDVTSNSSSFDDVMVNGDSVTINKTQYLLERITIEKQNGSQAESDTWELISVDGDPQNADGHAIAIELTSGATFTNVKRENIQINVKKEWNDNGSSGRPDSVEVNLLQNGTKYGESVTLNGSNNWSYAWEELPVVSEDGQTEFTYSVEEERVPGYTPEYEYISSVQPTGHWIPVPAGEAIVTGQRYVILSPGLDYALGITDKTENEQFSTENSFSVKTEEIIYNNTPIAAIPDAEMKNHSIIFRAEGTTSYSNSRTILKNTSFESWLLAQSTEKNYLKGCNNATYASGVKYNNGQIEIQRDWDKNNEWRVLTYSGGKFTTEETNSNNAAKLYKYVYTQVAADTTIQITNHRIENQTYTLDITKRSGIDPNVRLGGAEFQLLQDKNTLRFTKVADGAYTLSTDTTDDTLITANKTGKLVLRGLPAGTYTLRETKAPAGYETIEDMAVTLGAADDGNVSLTVELDIVDMPISYELPKTGGTGTHLYTMGGAGLIFLSLLLLLYNRIRRRKEAQSSS